LSKIIIFADSRFPSYAVRAIETYNALENSKHEIIDTNIWYNDLKSKISILRLLIIKRKFICLKFTPLPLLILIKLFNKYLIYDCDDAIWENSFFGIIKSKFIFMISNLVIFENSNLKSMSHKVNRNINNLILPCSIPQKNDNDKISFYETFPTFCYIGSSWHYKEILPILSKIDEYGLKWNLNFAGGTLDTSKYKNLNSYISYNTYDTKVMCDLIDRSDYGLTSPKKNEIDKGRGFRKKLLYISRGLLLIESKDYKKKFSISLDDCWNKDLYEKKIQYMNNIKIEKKYNNKIKNILLRLMDLLN